MLKKRNIDQYGTKNPHYKHGESGIIKSPEYTVWVSMLNRCTNKNNKNYASYGGRGITVCSLWATDFIQFIADMGRRPSPKHTLDRIDNEGNYSPENCRWATRKQQARNRRVTRLITINGKTKTLTEWSSEHNITPATVHARIYRLGWSPEIALTTPVAPKLPV